jgi:ABC-type nitrate/sulfonate/bicarbonate transport system substrate-binding protein
MFRLAILAALFVSTAHAADPPVTLRIGYLKGTTDLTLAKAHGSLEKALEPRGVSVTWDGPFPASAPAVEALNGGAVDLTGGSSTSFITSRAGGVKLVMFAYQPQSAGNEGIVVRADSTLHSLADLQGHTVAVNRGGTGEYLLVRALTKANVPADRVTRAYLAPPRCVERAERRPCGCLGNVGPVPVCGAAKRQRKAAGGWRASGIGERHRFLRQPGFPSRAPRRGRNGLRRAAVGKRLGAGA